MTAITQAGGSCGGIFCNVCLSVCLSVSVFPHDISKTNADSITKLDTEMFHHTSWQPIYFGVKRSKVKRQGDQGRKTSLCQSSDGIQRRRFLRIRQPRLVFPVVDAAADRRFFRAWSFSQRQKTLPVWAMALLWVLTYSISLVVVKTCVSALACKSHEYKMLLWHYKFLLCYFYSQLMTVKKHASTLSVRSQISRTRASLTLPSADVTSLMT